MKKGNLFLYIGGAISAIMSFLIILGYFWTPYSPTAMNVGAKFQAPSLEHLMGTDNFGRDIFSRVIDGAGTTFFIAVSVVAIGCALGILIGSLCGYYGGLPDIILTRICDSITAFPSFLLALVIISIMGSGKYNIIFALGILFIPSFARIVRSSILTVKSQEYIEAARACGTSTFRIILRHIIPNALAPIIVQASLGVAGAIITTASLSFIGLGVQPPTPEWGSMLSKGRQYIRNYWHLVTFPGVFIMTTVISLNLLGDGLRDALDPRLKR